MQKKTNIFSNRGTIHHQRVTLGKKMLIFGTGVKCDQSSDNMVNNITGYEKRGSSVKLKDISVTTHTYLGITS